MSFISKAKVIDIENGRAVIEDMGRKKTVSIRDDLKIKKGDNVVVSLGAIVGKTRK